MTRLRGLIDELTRPQRGQVIEDRGGAPGRPGRTSRPPPRLASSRGMKLIIQIPCLNEQDTLPATLADIPREVPGFDEV